MPRQAPLSIEVYDKNFMPKGAIGAPKFITVQPRFNAFGTATIGIPNDHRMIQHLVDNGRLWLRDDEGQHVMSGPVTAFRGSGPAASGQVEVDIIDDLSVLNEVLGWVIPSAAISAQGTAGENWVMTDNSETVLKAAVQANAIDRLAMNLSVATDLGRGAVITGKLRFHPLYERLFPTVDGAGLDGSGIGVTVQQNGSSRVLDVFEPSVYPRNLTEAGGVITDWSYRLGTATATRVVVGGQGEAQARVFRQYVNATLESSILRKIERFRDARDLDDVGDLPARGQETLDDGMPKSSVSVELSQTKNFIYGKGIRVGDRVVMQFGPGLVVDDVIREATLSWTVENGWKTTCKVGQREDDSDTMIARVLRDLARYLSNQMRT
jgi:hypothetical protein